MDLNSVMERLSRAEKEVFFLALTKMKIAEIASELNMTPRSVRFHLSNILRKTQLRSRIELILSYLESSRSGQVNDSALHKMQKQLNDVCRVVQRIQKQLDELQPRLEGILPSGRYDHQI